MLVLCCLYSSAQVSRQYNGVIVIGETNTIIEGVENRFVSDFNDKGMRFNASDVAVGDRIIDSQGNNFEITVISEANGGPTGGYISATVKCLDGVNISQNEAVLYRPSSKGIDLLGLSSDPLLTGTVINSALIKVNELIPTITTGNTFPTSPATIGDVGVYANSVFKFTAAGWTAVTGIPSSFGLNSGSTGDVVNNLLDGLYYICTGGTSWNPLPTLSALSLPPKTGDIFFNTTDNELYMLNSNSVWQAISNTSLPSGPASNFPTSPKVGDFFFDNVNNILYVYDALSRWVQVSINGSNPTGVMNPDPLVSVVKEGELFYNSTDKKIYFYNGTAWVSLSNSLMSGQIFIGNSSNVPVSVPLSGDATISNIGKLTISNNAVTDTKLDKANIPISGFGYANNNIVIGTGSPFYQIKGVASPTNPEDVSTKSYVDLSFAVPALLGLTNNSVFVGNASNKAVAVLKSAVPISDFGRATASISMNPVAGPYVNKITELANPTSPQDASTKYYVDNHAIMPSSIPLPNNQILVGTSGGVASAVAKSTVSFSDFGAATNDVLMGGKNLKNLREPINPQDAATMNYVDSKALSLTSNYVFQGDATNKPVGVQKVSISLSDWGLPTSSISMAGTNLTDLADPRLTSAGLQDAATRKYVDGKVGNVTTGTTPPVSPIVGTTYYNTTDKIFYVYDGVQWIPVNNVLPNGSFYIGDISNKAVPILKSSIPLSGFGAAAAAIDLGTNKIINVVDPIGDQDAATKKYVDAKAGSISTGTTPPTSPTIGTTYYNTNDKIFYVYDGTGWVPVNNILPTGNFYIGDAFNKAVPVVKSAITLSGFGDAQANLSMGTGSNNYKIVNLADPAGDHDASTKKYVDSKVGTSPSGPTPPTAPVVGSTYYNTTDKMLYVYDGTQWNPVGNNTLPTGQLYVGDASNKAVATAKNTIPLSGFAAAAADIDLGTHKIANVVDPVANQDAATKKYVDGKAGSIPTGTTPPSSPTTGTTYYNTNDKTFYVYDGTSWIPVNNVLPTGQLYVGDASNKAAATAKNAIPLSGFGTPGSDIAFGTFKITGLGDPAADQDAATKKYVDGKTGSIPTGTIPPTSPTTGTTYYNTNDKIFYVYDGTGWIPVNNILPTGNFYIGDASNKAVPVVKSAITLSGFGDAQANLSMGTGANNYKIINVADPVGNQDAATKKYVDGKTGSLPTGTTPPSNPTIGTTYYNTNDKTYYVYDGTSWIPVNNVLPTGQLYVGDASNKAAATAKNTIPLSGFGTPVSDIAFGAFKITGLADPAADQDAATKKYVDGKTGSIPTGTIPPTSPTTGTTYYNTNDKIFYVYDGTGWIPVNNILPTGNFYIGDASNKAVPVVKSAITLSGFGDAQANLSMGTGANNYKIINVADPVGDQDAATKKYVDGKTGRIPTGTIPPTSPTTGTTYYNTNDKTYYVYDGTSWIPVNNVLPTGQLYVGDASNKATATAKNAIPLSGFAAAAADIDLGTHKIANVVDPVADQDAATKKYVDGKTGSIPTGTIPPTSPTTGTTYYNTNDKIFYVYDGTGWIPVNNILPTGSFYIGDASNKAVPVVKSAITLSGFGDAQANLSMGTGSNNYKIINIADPVGDQDAATKKYVDTKAGSVPTTPPATPVVGSTYYDTTTNTFNVYTGPTLGWVPVQDNLGNHIATKNLTMGDNYISYDGVNGHGLKFDVTTNNASFGEDLTVNGNFYTPSDKRLKTNIETLGNALQAIDSMRGVRFEYKDQRKYAKGPKVGVIAQELMKVYPEMVTKGADGFFKVDYTQLTGVLIQAVKEQQQQMKQQQLEINELKGRLDKQQLQIDAILKKIN